MHQFPKFTPAWNYMFRAVPLPIIRTLFTVHSALVYVIQVWRELSSGTRMESSSILVLLESCFQACMTYNSAVCTVIKLLMMGSTILVPLESSLQTCMTYTSAECTVNKLLMMGSSILVLLESSLQNCMIYTSAECTVNKLLMMGRGTARNMYGHMNVKTARNEFLLQLLLILSPCSELSVTI